MTSAFSWQNSISLCPASFCTPRPNLPVTPGISWLPTFAFWSPIMKRTSFCGLILEGLVGLHQLSSVQLLSHVRLFATLWITAPQASLSITNSQTSLILMSIESVMQSSHLILCHPLLLLPLIPPSIRVFSNESALHMRWPKYWSFSFSISPSVDWKINTQDWSPLGWTGWISLQSKGLSRVFFNTTFKSINSSVLSSFHSPTLTSIHDHRKNHSLD